MTKIKEKLGYFPEVSFSDTLTMARNVCYRPLDDNMKANTQIGLLLFKEDGSTCLAYRPKHDCNEHIEIIIDDTMKLPLCYGYDTIKFFDLGNEVKFTAIFIFSK